MVGKFESNAKLNSKVKVEVEVEVGVELGNIFCRACPTDNSNTPHTRTKLRKRLSFHTSAGSIKRKADLFELPTINKKVKTSGEIESTSSTENLLLDFGETDYTYMNPGLA